MLLCRAVCRCSGVDGGPEFFEHARGVGAQCRFPNCLAGATLYLRVPDAFSALEASEINDAANVTSFAQVRERLVDLIELVVAGDQLV
jgi:hypothetical protein